MNFGQIVLILSLIALNAFFVAVEFSVVASRRSRLDLFGGADSRGASLLQRWLEDEASRERLIAAAQLGITIVSLALGAASKDAIEAALAPALENISLTLPINLSFLNDAFAALPLLITLGVVTGFHVVLGEQVPKVAVSRDPERFAVASAPFMQLFLALFRGFIAVLDWATHGILTLFGLPANGNSHSAVISLEELRQMVSGPDAGGIIQTPEREMLSAVINFGELVVRQVSIPRTEIIAVESTATIGEAVRLAAHHGVTKLPVYEENLDQVIGILHLKDLLPALLEDANLQNRPARALARETLFVPESISVNDLLVHMRARRQHMAITLDEFGGTAGLVTLEDLLEEIVGDVRDPFDVAQPDIQMMPDGSALIDGMSLIDDVNQAFALSLYDPDYDTIAGFVLGKLGRIAQVGDVVEDCDNHVRLRVESMDRLRIARVHLSRVPVNNSE